MSEKTKNITVALTGNPNSGKTTVFNMLTGARQHVGNYPGVTVEKITGICRHKDYKITFVDLPGTYSLSAYSTEELIARNFLIDEQPDVVVDVVDSSNIERNLYLATQLIEMNQPLVLAFNMSDIAARKGLVFDIPQLERLLEARIVQTVGSRVKGRDELLDSIIETAAAQQKQRTHKVHYGEEIEKELTKLEAITTEKASELAGSYGPRWLGLKLLENDSDIISKIQSSQIRQQIEAANQKLKKILGDEPEMIIADRRYGFISGACQETIKTTVQLRHDISDRIDAFITSPILGLPIFLVLMYLVFQLTFTIGSYTMAWLEVFFQWLGTAITQSWTGDGHSWLRSLLVDGVISGVGGVVVFLPNILLLFAAIAILEGTGYMARAAFIMDRIMHKIGLHGKSFIPMLIGFGCSVPAIMATRILENRRNRFTTIMIVPLMSCGARLTIYGLFIPAFFAERWRGSVLMIVYLIGIILAVVCAKILRVTLFKGETIPFVMELPPYRVPTLKSICIHTWQRGWMYLKKAGTVILAISIVLWAAMSYPKPNLQSLKGLTNQQAQRKTLEGSVIGGIGKTIEPILKPLGFDWKIGTALIGATAAKEVFVSQLGIVYAVGSGDKSKQSLRQRLQENYTPLVGFCVMLFCLISAPCIATVVMTGKETGSWRWAVFQFLGLTVLAYLITLVVYQIGCLF
ncbi:MAG: ferrous iron transport protein B [Planctomycetota bacterium]